MRQWLEALFTLRPASRHELAGIQYVRGLAALMVVLDHVDSMMAEPKYYGRHPFDGVFGAGAAAVFGLALAITYQRDIIWQVVVIGLVSCATLAAACAARPPRGKMGDIGRRFGDASYCIYLVHTAFVSAVLGVASHGARHLPDVVIVAGTFLVAAIGGLVLHYVAERPIVAWSQRLMFPRRIEGR